MKTDRFLAAPARIVAAVLAGLLLATGLSAAGGQFRINLGPLAVTIESPGKKLAAALAREVAEAEKRFAAKREALPVVRVTGQEPAYPRTEVLGLIEDTRTDLVQAVDHGLHVARESALHQLQLDARDGVLLERVAQLEHRVDHVALAVLDDAALLAPTAGYRVVSTDACVEQVHFWRSWLTPQEVGARAAAAARRGSITAPREQAFVKAVHTWWRGDTPVRSASSICDRRRFWPWPAPLYVSPIC